MKRLLRIAAVFVPVAMLYLFGQKIRPAREQGVSVVQGVAHSYHGVPGESTLISALKGSMSPMIEGHEFVALSEWAAAGATEEGYASVAPIVNDNCASCHTPGDYPPVVTNYAPPVPVIINYAPAPTEATSSTSRTPVTTRYVPTESVLVED